MNNRRAATTALINKMAPRPKRNRTENLEKLFVCKLKQKLVGNLLRYTDYFEVNDENAKLACS